MENSYAEAEGAAVGTDGTRGIADRQARGRENEKELKPGALAMVKERYLKVHSAMLPAIN